MHTRTSSAALARAGLLGLALWLAACSNKAPKPAYTGEKFSPDSPFALHLSVGPLAACQFGQRALLSQGYQVNNSDAQSIRGTKYFQPKADHQMQLDITLVCLPGSEGATIYASAVQTRYEIKASASNTAVSVAGIGSVNLPWTEGKEALVKVGEETVADPDFYTRLFELLKRFAE